LRTLLILLLVAVPVCAWAGEPRDATRREVGERFCLRSEACLAAIRRDLALNRPIQWLIFTLSQVHYGNNPDNAERAYDTAIRAMEFANEFLSDKEIDAGQTDYGGGNGAALRQIFTRYSVACENKRSWLAKHRCLTRALYPLLPEQYRPELVQLGVEPEAPSGQH
jgi:hypothetical protein